MPGENGIARPKAGFISLLIETRFDPEVGRFVSGSPELEVWSSGDTNTESEKRAQEAIRLFLEEVPRLGTVWEILDEAGYRVGFSIPPAVRDAEARSS